MDPGKFRIVDAYGRVGTDGQRFLHFGCGAELTRALDWYMVWRPLAHKLLGQCRLIAWPPWVCGAPVRSLGDFVQAPADSEDAPRNKRTCAGLDPVHPVIVCSDMPSMSSTVRVM